MKGSNTKFTKEGENFALIQIGTGIASVILLAMYLLLTL
jgi:hypothetical protein